MPELTDEQLIEEFRLASKGGTALTLLTFVSDYRDRLLSLLLKGLTHEASR